MNISSVKNQLVAVKDFFHKPEVQKALKITAIALLAISIVAAALIATALLVPGSGLYILIGVSTLTFAAICSLFCEF